MYLRIRKRSSKSDFTHVYYLRHVLVSRQSRLGRTMGKLRSTGAPFLGVLRVTAVRLTSKFTRDLTLGKDLTPAYCVPNVPSLPREI